MRSLMNEATPEPLRSNMVPVEAQLHNINAIIFILKRILTIDFVCLLNTRIDASKPLKSYIGNHGCDDEAGDEDE